MKSRVLIILLLSVVAIAFHSCDSDLNIDKPKDFYKYIGVDGNQTAVDMVVDAEGNSFILGSSSATTIDGVAVTGRGQQLYVVMANTSGEVVWQKDYGEGGDK